ncbi:MAG: Na+/H+ antiporter NhaA [Acidimicrobiales bacterium]
MSAHHREPLHPRPPTALDTIKRPMQRLIHLETISGIALIIGATIAVALATSSLGHSVDEFWHQHLLVEIGPIHLDETLTHWINDALMTIFFLVAGLEIKREMVHGDLRQPRKAALPIAAAIGGMAIPALIYVALAGGGDAANGWGVPMATDIAFAVGILTLLGNKVPSKLKILLLTLAIVDDLGAILVIAVFYSDSIDTTSLGLAGVGLATMVVLKQLKVWWMPIYVIVGAAVWYWTFESGVHATLAGVACGLLAPASPHSPETTLVKANPESTFDELKEIIFETRESIAVTDRLIHTLHPWTALMIVPLFAAANAGVSVAPSDVADAVGSSVFWATFVGLVVGKPLGITAAAFLAVKSGVAKLPDGIGWMHVLGMSGLAGIGFTVSIFISGLAFDDATIVGHAKIAILLASVAASIFGAVLIKAAGGDTRGRVDDLATGGMHDGVTPDELRAAAAADGSHDRLGGAPASAPAGTVRAGDTTRGARQAPTQTVQGTSTS